MAITDRQNKLLKAEDWKRIYQTFRNADFKSYDFDNLRRTMINYLRENYPEDFNDYIESSEYIALIDLIAFLGQNISYRVDLNARDNFLELAERRESVLRHARLLSYNPKRNKPANGLLKLVSLSTTESIVDSNNLNLANQSILWNDTTNTNWREQYTRILNAALPVQNGIGKPLKAGSVNGVTTQLYRFNSTSNTVPVYEFSKAIDNKKESFEVVSTNFDNDSIYEEAPLPGNNLAFLYRDNGRGPGSSNSGYFLHFRQGKLLNNQFNLEVAAPHETVDVNTANINNDDVWLYKLNADGNESDLWNKVDAVEGNNIVYNSLEKNVKLSIELNIEKGRGYVPAEENKKQSESIGVIAIDSIYTPIKNVKYDIENYRVEQKTDYEKLVFEIVTDGSIHPKDALTEAAKILIHHFMLFSDELITLEADEIAQSETYDEESLHMRQLLKTKLIDMDLSVRALNCLKAAEVDTLGDLVSFNKNDLMKFRNFGRKSLTELEELVILKGLSFGMDLSKYKLDKD